MGKRKPSINMSFLNINYWLYNTTKILKLVHDLELLFSLSPTICNWRISIAFTPYSGQLLIVPISDIHRINEQLAAAYHPSELIWNPEEDTLLLLLLLDKLLEFGSGKDACRADFSGSVKRRIS